MRFSFLWVFCILIPLCAEAKQEAVVYNETLNMTGEWPIYAAIYYKKISNVKLPSRKIGPVYEIRPRTKDDKTAPNIRILLPAIKMGYDRMLLVSYEKNELQDTLESKDFNTIQRKEIMPLLGNEYHVVTEEDALNIHNSVEWKVINPIIQKIIDPIQKGLIESTSHQYENKVATVRTGDDLAPQEITLFKKRKITAKKALEKFLGVESLTHDETPNVVIAFSGGGYRAMTGSCGSTEALIKNGLWDAALCSSYLSGSEWEGTQLLALSAAKNMSFDDIKKSLRAKIQKNLFLPSDIVSGVLDTLLAAKVLSQKAIYNQIISSIDFFGLLLSNRFLTELGGKKNTFGLSDCANYISSNKMPFPIFTVLIANKQVNDWGAFTPYEFECEKLKLAIPIWALGRTFLAGVSTNFAPEQAAGFLPMAIGGSAISFTAKDFIADLQNKIPLAKKFKVVTQTKMIDDVRFFPAMLHNPAYGMEGSPAKNIPTLTFVDAGMTQIGIPYRPLERRIRLLPNYGFSKAHVIIICDYSAGAIGAVLKRIEADAKKRGVAFPELGPIEKFNTKKVTVFKGDVATGVPTIIYMPLIKNEDYSKTFDPKAEEAQGKFCNTFTLQYTGQQFDLLSGLAKKNLEDSEDTIRDAIKDVIKDMKDLKEKAKITPKQEMPSEQKTDIKEEGITA